MKLVLLLEIKFAYSKWNFFQLLFRKMNNCRGFVHTAKCEKLKIFADLLYTS